MYNETKLIKKCSVLLKNIKSDFSQKVALLCGLKRPKLNEGSHGHGGKVTSSSHLGPFVDKEERGYKLHGKAVSVHQAH